MFWTSLSWNNGHLSGGCAELPYFLHPAGRAIKLWFSGPKRPKYRFYRCFKISKLQGLSSSYGSIPAFGCQFFIKNLGLSIFVGFKLWKFKKAWQLPFYGSQKELNWILLIWNGKCYIIVWSLVCKIHYILYVLVVILKRVFLKRNSNTKISKIFHLKLSTYLLKLSRFGRFPILQIFDKITHIKWTLYELFKEFSISLEIYYFE